MIVSAIAVTPVKGLGLNHPSSVMVDECGVRGDRRYALLDSSGSIFNGKRCGALVHIRASINNETESLTLDWPDGSRICGQVELGSEVTGMFYGSARFAREVLGEFSSALSNYVGEGVRLVRLRDGDGIDRVGSGAVSLQSMASLEAIARALSGSPVDGRRFRMTFTIDGAEQHVEDTWVGRPVHIGDVIVVPEGNVGRCAVTRQNPETGVSDIDTLGAIADYRANVPTTEPLPFGVHARVIVPGRVALGDAVTVE